MKEIRKAYLQTYKGEFATEATYVAFMGCEKLGIPYETFDYNEIHDLEPKKDTIVFGGIAPIRHALKIIGASVPEPLDIPQELIFATNRNIKYDTLRNVRNNGVFPLFVKPRIPKLFTGFVMKSNDELDYIENLTMDGDEIELMTSSVVNFVSEYRVFVSNKKIIDCRKYKGNWRVLPNFEEVEYVIGNYDSQPISYAIDFGATEAGETQLIEVNDGYSIGTYGLDCVEYVKMCILRWNEILNNK